MEHRPNPLKPNDLQDHRVQPGALWLRTILLKNGLTVRDEQLLLLERYVESLLDWNRKINLVSRKDAEHVWENHILHSLSILFKVRLPHAAAALDLGTGGGLPGIPLKILVPGIHMTLLDSIQKKVTAVQDILDRLSITGVKTVCGRAEEVGMQAAHSQSYDLVLARGVAPLRDLIKYAELFLKHESGVGEADMGAAREDGREEIRPPALLAFKGGVLEEELAKAKRLGRVKAIRTVDLVFRGSEEHSLSEKKIVVVEF